MIPATSARLPAPDQSGDVSALAGAWRPALVACGALVGAALAPWVHLSAGTAAGRAAMVAIGAGVAGAVGAWRLHAVWTLAVAVCLLALGLALRALVPLDGPVPGRLEATVAVRSDPIPGPGGGLELVVAHDGRRLLAAIDGPGAGEAAGLQMGDSLRVAGTVRPLSSPTSWHRSRHLAGQLTVQRIGRIHPGRGPWAVAAGVRERIRTSVEPLAPDSRALVLGAALGDDRDQGEAQRDRFLRSGLTHLLVVSGQNVALVLVMCSGLLARVPVHRRWLVTAAVVAWFVMTVRPDPSVLRAAASALATALATHRGRVVSPAAVLATALTAVVLVDPLIIGSLGFWLSAAATAGLVVGLGHGARRRGGDWNPVVVARATLAAQVGVAPVLALAGLAVPLASFPANVAAGAPAGVMTLWGMSAGVVCASLPPSLAAVVRAPVGLAAWWVDGVARWSARLPLGRLTPGETLVLLTGAGLFWARRRWTHSRPRRLGLTRAMGVGLAIAVLWCGWPRQVRSGPMPGGCLLVDARSQVLVLANAPPSERRLLRALADGEVRHLNAVVVGDGGLRLNEAALEVAAALPVDTLINAEGSLPGSIDAGGTLTIGGVLLDPDEPTCPAEVRAEPGSQPG